MSATVEKPPPRRFPPPCWTQNEALSLIQSYGDRWHALRRGYLRTADWDAVADDVGRLCPGAIPPKTSAQCRHKMEKLRQRHRAEKQRALSFSGGHFQSTWFFFQAMEAMERNGSGSVQDDERMMGLGNGSGGRSGGVQMQVVNVKSGVQDLKSSVFEGLNPGRGIRFKPVVGTGDGRLVTVAARGSNGRVSQSYVGAEEENDDEFEEEYIADKKFGKGQGGGVFTQSYGTRFQSEYRGNDDGVGYSDGRIRKCSKVGVSASRGPGYWNENGEEEDEEEENDVGEEDVWVKMPKDRSSVSMDYKRESGERYFDGESEFARGVKRENDSIGQIVSSIKVLADGFVKMERMKMDMVHEIEKMRMEAEMKRNKLLLESQRQIVEAFAKGLSENKKQRR